jgi:hypothetical protein
MKASEMVTALRICGNHPSMEGKTCADCPFDKQCSESNGGARMSLEAADIIEELMKELAKARVGA